MSKILKSNNHYLKEPNNCPNCDSEDIIGDELIVDDENVVTQEISCSICEYQWTDIYKLTGFTSI